MEIKASKFLLFFALVVVLTSAFLYYSMKQAYDQTVEIRNEVNKPVEEKNDMKAVGGAMHGDRLTVSYVVLNVGKHMLFVREKIGEENKKAVFKDLESIDLNIQEGESFAPYNGFECSVGTEQVYAVIQEKSAKALRAWRVDVGQMKLLPIGSDTVTCEKTPEIDPE